MKQLVSKIVQLYLISIFFILSFSPLLSSQNSQQKNKFSVEQTEDRTNLNESTTNYLAYHNIPLISQNENNYSISLDEPFSQIIRIVNSKHLEFKSDLSTLQFQKIHYLTSDLI